MTTFLLISTIVSVALAAGLAIVLAGMRREERRRSEARVQLLSGLASRRSSAPGAASSSAHAVPTLGDVEMRPGGRAPMIQDLFHERQESSAWAHRLAVIGVLVVLLGISALSFRQISRWNGKSSGLAAGSGAPLSTAAPTAAAPSAAAPANGEVPPLELLSMRHASEERALTVTGMVRNPRSGKLLKGVNATVLVFAPGGSFVTTMRTPLDYTTLAPGEESPFVIRVPLTAAVERYRIGFRTDDGRVLSHVDRRAPESIAQKQAP